MAMGCERSTYSAGWVTRKYWSISRGSSDSDSESENDSDIDSDSDSVEETRTLEKTRKSLPYLVRDRRGGCRSIAPLASAVETWIQVRFILSLAIISYFIEGWLINRLAGVSWIYLQRVANSVARLTLRQLCRPTEGARVPGIHSTSNQHTDCEFNSYTVLRFASTVTRTWLLSSRQSTSNIPSMTNMLSHVCCELIVLFHDVKTLGVWQSVRAPMGGYSHASTCYGRIDIYTYIRLVCVPTIAA